MSHEAWLVVVSPCQFSFLQDAFLWQLGSPLPAAALIPKGACYSADSMQKHCVSTVHSLCVHLSFV